MSLIAKRIACFGDSITKGNVSFDWVSELSEDFKKSDLVFRNFGVNGELAYNGYQRLQEIVDFNPDLITILFGSNDVMAANSEASSRFYMKREGLPQIPNLAWYVDNMRAIIESLNAKTTAKMVCITIPVLGEDLNDTPNSLVNLYNAELKNICKTYHLDVLDLHSQMVKYLEEHPQVDPYKYQNDRGLVIKAAIKKYLRYRNWNKVSEAHGFLLSHDGIHLNETSGGFLLKLVKEYLQSWARLKE